MKRRSHFIAVCTGVVAWLLMSSAAAVEPRQLRHNPFSRPPSERTIVERGAGLDNGTGAPAIDLRATMVSTNDKLANIGGRILRPGDDVQGYSLLQVFEDRAVFVREGKELTIYVKPERMEDDEVNKR